MKKYLFTIPLALYAVLCFFTPAQAHAAFTVVNNCTFTASASVTSSTCNLGTVNAGDLIIVADKINSSGVTATTTDSGGDNFINATFKLGSGSGRQILFYAANVAGGSNYIVSTTYSGSGTNFSGIAVFEISGVATTNPLDTATTTNTSLSATITGQYSAGTSTTAFAGDFEFAAGNGPGFSQGNGFTLLGSTSTINEATTTGAAGTYNAFFTTTSTSGSAIANQAFFKPIATISAARRRMALVCTAQ